MPPSPTSPSTAGTPVLPVVVLDRADDAVPTARALLDGGIDVIEVTLRTPAALEAVRRIAAEVPEICLGVGSVRRPRDVETSLAAGAQFLVSPGFTSDLLAELAACPVPAYPGTATVGEVMTVLEAGLTEMKLFPAEVSGGTAFLQALRGPVPEARFCPTGGVRISTAPAYLALPNVVCVGGTWLAPPDVVAAQDWARITALAREAVGLRLGDQTQAYV